MSNKRSGKRVNDLGTATREEVPWQLIITLSFMLIIIIPFVGQSAALSVAEANAKAEEREAANSDLAEQLGLVQTDLERISSVKARLEANERDIKGQKEALEVEVGTLRGQLERASEAMTRLEADRQALLDNTDLLESTLDSISADLE